MNINLVLTAVAKYGLVGRGGFVVDVEDGVPAVGEGSDASMAAKYLLLFGNVGSSIWDSFSQSDEYMDGEPHPLNRWSMRIGSELAAQFSARALFPFSGAPYLPFLRWAKKAEGLQNSKLGILIHPQFGLWHAYRFALAFVEIVETEVPVQQPELICAKCVHMPCQSACPVDAFSGGNYHVRVCVDYLQEHPDSECMTLGCRARLACPQGTDYHYEPAHAAFHMHQFVATMVNDNLPKEMDEVGLGCVDAQK